LRVGFEERIGETVKLESEGLKLATFTLNKKRRITRSFQFGSGCELGRLIGETQIKLPEVGTLSIYESKNTVKPRRIMKNS